MKISKLFLVLFIAVLLFSGCGGGESAPATTSTNQNSDEAQESVDQEGISGEVSLVESSNAPNILLKEGVFWTYKWQETITTSGQGISTTVDNSFNEFTITLGAPIVLNAIEAFPLTIKGDSGSNTPRWKYLAISDDKSLLGSTGGSFTVIYSAISNEWDGGGFFIDFDDATVSVRSSTYEGIYNTLDAIMVSHKDSSGGCEYILGHTLCEDSSSRTTLNEYYKKGLGTVGLYKYSYHTYSGGGFSSAHTKELFLELINSSLSASDGSVLKQPSWQEVATLPRGVSYHSIAAVNSKIHISSRSSDKLQVYDTKTGEFDKEVTMIYAPYNLLLHNLGGALYAMSKESDIIRLNQDGIWEYTNSSSGEYATTTTYNYINKDLNLTYNHMISMSATNGLGTYFGVSLFNPYTNEWLKYDNPKRNSSRWGWFKIIAIGDTLYLVGGSYLSDSVWNVWSEPKSIARFDLLDNSWLSNTTNLATARDKGFALLEYNSKLLVIGGVTRGGKTLSTVEEYNPTTNSWKNLEPLPEPLTDIKAVTIGNKIYVVTRNKILTYTP